MTLVLDSSVVLAVLFEEPGQADAIAALGDGVISAVSVAEVITVLQRREFTEQEATEALAALKVSVLAFDGDQALTAGLLNRSTQGAGLSLGDRACLALARHLRTEAVTTDRAWLRVAEAAGVRVRLIR